MPIIVIFKTPAPIQNNQNRLLMLKYRGLKEINETEISYNCITKYNTKFSVSLV